MFNIRKKIFTFFKVYPTNYADCYNLASKFENEGKTEQAIENYKSAYFYLNRYIQKAKMENIYTVIDEKNRELIKSRIKILGGEIFE
jgi:hypothetical protein